MALKGSEKFKETIKAYLDKLAETSDFALSYGNPVKSLDECVNYILSEVQKSGCNGFDDDEIFGMAVHYYDEEDLGEIKTATAASVVVNHHVELTEEEKEEAKRKALERITEEEVRKQKEKERKARETEKSRIEAQKKKEEDEGLMSLFGEE